MAASLWAMVWDWYQSPWVCSVSLRCCRLGENWRGGDERTSRDCCQAGRTGRRASGRLRGSIVGFFIGILPGPSGAMSSFASDAMEKRLLALSRKIRQRRDPGSSRTGISQQLRHRRRLHPALSLDSPLTSSWLFSWSALDSWVQPGPLFHENYPELFWGKRWWSIRRNLMLLVLNLPLIGIVWVRLLKVPYVFLYPLILLFLLIRGSTP